ncbi:MAG: FKBP-type peptidyl-prolyl cis-trans isomerase [Candidatus Micrarchaeota archaeon]
MVFNQNCLYLVFLFFSIIAVGCTSDQKNTVSTGDTIFVYITSYYEDGSIYTTNDIGEAKLGGIYKTGNKYEPTKYVVGTGGPLKWLDEAAIGMKVGERKTVQVPIAKPSNMKRGDYIRTLPLEDIRGLLRMNGVTEKPAVGMIIELNSGGGSLNAVITSVNETHVVIDLYPYAVEKFGTSGFVKTKIQIDSLTKTSAN